MDKKQRTLVAIGFIAVVAITGLWGVDISQGYVMVSELVSEPQEHVGSNVNTMGTIKNGTLTTTPEMISFVLEDAEDDTFAIYVEYTADAPANLVEGKDVTISGKMIDEGKIEASKIVIGCPSKYKEQN
jgi:cytochrome c-type biogenesis protein CcmE